MSLYRHPYPTFSGVIYPNFQKSPIKPYENLFSHPFFFIFISCDTVKAAEPNRPRLEGLACINSKKWDKGELTKSHLPRERARRMTVSTSDTEGFSWMT